MENRLDTVVFDLGGVLIRVGYQRALDWLAARGFTPASSDEFMSATRLREHERGEMDGEAFFANVNRLLSAPAGPEELHRWWTGFFSPEESMLALARGLRDTHRVFVLSNTGPLHWRQAMEQFALRDVADDFLTSFETGFAKPDAAIYAAAERRFALRPSRTVFIDDLPENIAAARSAGWHGIHHTGFDSTHGALRDLGVVQR